MNINFVRIFAHGSSLMLILFDLFLSKKDDSNESTDILNIILSCQTIYRTCNIFILRRRIEYTKTIHFDKNMLNSVIKLLCNSNESMMIDRFPNLKKLTFGRAFNQPLNEGYLPSNLTHLTFGCDFNQPLNEGYLPSNLTQLTFGKCFNQPLKKGYLPSNLTQLTFGYFFNPSSLLPLNEGYLPSNLTQLTFGGYFNQPLKEVYFPSNLTYLSIHKNYEYSIKSILPSSV